MQLEYLKLGIWAVSTIFLVIAVEGWSEYSDVDLRIAERKAIPHYIRHQYEYADIDIKQIMRQRGIVPKPYNRDSHFQRGTHFNHVQQQQRPVTINGNRSWRQYNKMAELSNHIFPNQDRYFLKKQRKHRNSLENKNYKIRKFWRD